MLSAKSLLGKVKNKDGLVQTKRSSQTLRKHLIWGDYLKIKGDVDRGDEITTFGCIREFHVTVILNHPRFSNHYAI